MKNKFVLALPENGFGYPCNICAYNDNTIEFCKECIGYDGPFIIEKLDMKFLMERDLGENE